MRMTEDEYADLLAKRKASNVARTRSEKAENWAQGAAKRERVRHPIPAILKAQKAVYSFVVPGVPVAKGRPRLGNGHVYTPAKTTRAEQAVASCAGLAQVKRITGALRMSLTFVMPAPKTSTRALPAVRPDLDNLAKTVLDGLNGVAYLDDGQIVELVLVKEYGPIPQTQVDIHEL